VILFAAALVLLVLAALIEIAPGLSAALRDSLFRILIVAGCAVGAVPAFAVLAGSTVNAARIPAAVPGGAWVFGMDALSAVFLLAIFGVGAAVAAYGVTYQAHERPRRPVSGAHALVALELAALAVVVTARAVVPFLMAWETMAVVAYFLVIFEAERPAVRRAGLFYLVATHTGTLTLFAMFALWGTGAHNLSFAALAEHARMLPAHGSVVLALALIGFGIKAGIVPFHFWLPEAHAAAPSHISALMSGLVIKMGIYGLLRVLFLVAMPAAWWGWLMLGIGATSGILGVVWALAQHDLKRLLAFHSVENIGIICMGVGAGALGITYGHPVVAVLGFAGAVLHTLNHALFKSLLFLGAGSVIRATGTRDIERLGGLATRMPVTAATFLIGSAAIVGLPPLNGFLSEWLVYRSLLHAGIAVSGVHTAVVAVAALALIGALALACFTKVVGIIYLGRPRDMSVFVHAHESSVGIKAPMIALAAACVAIGLIPVVVVPAVLRVGRLVAGIAPSGIGAPMDAALGQLTGFMIALGLGVTVAAILRSRSLAPSTVRAGTWACGFEPQTAHMQYSASSFAAPLLAAFGPVTGVTVHRTQTTFATHPTDVVLERLVRPAWRGLRGAASRLRPIQQGRVGLQLLYLATAMIALLVYLIAAGPSQ
jgi:hydrogenase-4 component B